jgi:hypothetical protein
MYQQNMARSIAKNAPMVEIAVECALSTFF